MPEYCFQCVGMDIEVYPSRSRMEKKVTCGVLNDKYMANIGVFSETYNYSLYEILKCTDNYDNSVMTD